jgi:hypothetical protein
MTDGDWARLKPGYERWLRTVNFDEAEHQRSKLTSDGLSFSPINLTCLYVEKVADRALYVFDIDAGKDKGESA